MRKYFVLILMIIFISKASPAYAQSKNHPKKKIILMIGDGMGVAQIYAGLTANKGTLNLERCTAIGFHKNQSSDNYITVQLITKGKLAAFLADEQLPRFSEGRGDQLVKSTETALKILN